jgi:hypothetical protein
MYMLTSAGRPVTPPFQFADLLQRRGPRRRRRQQVQGGRQQGTNQSSTTGVSALHGERRSFQVTVR